MEKTQVYLRKEELEALRSAAARSGRSVAELVREAIRQVVLKPAVSGPVAIWDGKPKRTSIEHDSIHDQPWEYFRRPDLHKLSAVDATSLAIMKRARIRVAYSFDHHFSVVGFRLVT